MATNYVDYDYWTYGYGDGDLTVAEPYVLSGYWDAGYAVNEDLTVATITGTATVTAKAVNFVLGTASITGSATVTALCVPDLYVTKGYWIAGYCENEPLEPSASITATATVTGNAQRLRQAVGSITANAQMQAAAVNFVIGKASIDGTAAASAAARMVYSGNASVNGTGSLHAIGTITYNVPMAFTGMATVDATGNVIGYEWNDLTPETNSWSESGGGYVDYDYWMYGYTDGDLLGPAEVWQTVTPKTNAWLRQ